MRANILLRATGMRDRDKRPDQFPFLIGKFITTGFPTLEGLQLSLRLFAVKLSRLLSCLQEPVYADGVLSVDLY